jgi:putative Mn2+ efflux pump MntP
VLAATAVWGLVEAVRGDNDAPRAWHGWRLLVSGAALSLDDFAVGLALGALAVAAVITFGVFSAVLTPIEL